MSNYEMIENAKKKDIENQDDSCMISEESLPGISGGNPDLVGGFCCNWCGLYLPTKELYAIHMKMHF